MNKIAKLYKLYTLEGDETYIGYTFDTLENRISKHYKAYQEYKEDKRKFHDSFSLFEKYKDNVFIELIKQFDNIKDKDLLKHKRNEYIKKSNNKDKVKLTKAQYALEWKEQNKQRLHDYYQIYYKQNLDRIRERYRQRWTCEVCNINLNKWSRVRHEKTKLHQSLLNNIPIQTKNKRITCECGCTIVSCPYHINKHKATDKHKRFMELKKNNNDE
jgi:hypothetical protein